jgi:small subunit ribosomal protein S20
MVKKVRTLAGSGDVNGAKAALADTIKRLDQAADKHLIHKNKASRTKSRLTVLLNKAAASPAKPVGAPPAAE